MYVSVNVLYAVFYEIMCVILDWFNIFDYTLLDDCDDKVIVFTWLQRRASRFYACNQTVDIYAFTGNLKLEKCTERTCKIFKLR